MIEKSVQRFLLTSALLLSACAEPPARDAPRSLPWAAIDISKASAVVSVDEQGRLVIEITHQPLLDISPDMVRWFYQQLPISTVTYQGKVLPWYHIFHPSEHGQIQVTEPALNNQPGMAPGALVSRFEWFGHYNSHGSGRILAMDSNGMTVSPEVAGLGFGEIQHQFIAHHWGTEYRLRSVLGVDWPFSNAINKLIRTRKFPAAMVQQWIRHQQEEVASLNYFLPRLYQQRHTNQYALPDTPPE